MSMIRFIAMTVLCIVCAALPAWATTRYVDGTLAATCVGATYSIASRNCSGADGPGYKTPPEGWRAAVAGDTVYHRAGTYVVTSVYGNSASDTYGPGGGSWANATKFKNYPGEAVVLQHSGINMDNSVSTGGVNYLIWQGDTRANFITEMYSGADNSGFRVNNAVHHVRFQTLTVRNFTAMGIQGGTSCSVPPAYIEIVDALISNNGTDTNQEHAIYPACSADWLIEKNHLLANQAYGVHMWAGIASTNYHMRNTIRFNVIEGRKSTGTGGAHGIAIRHGSGHSIHHNVIIGLGTGAVRLSGGIQILSPSSGVEVYNNTIYDTAIYGIYDEGSNNLVKNNILNVRAGADPVVPGTGIVATTNHCLTADTGCSVTGSPGFVSAGSDFSLTAASTAIDAGTAIVGYAYNGSAPDQGAYEMPVFASCVVENGDASTIRVTYTNNVFPPLLPATGVTGFTARKATVNDVITAAVVTGDNRVDLTLTDAIINGNAVDISSSGSGNLTDSALIGNATNQPYNTVLTNQSCTNNVGAPATHVFSQTVFRFSGLRGAETAPVATPYASAPESTAISIIPGGKVRLRLLITCTTSNCPPTGFYPRYQRNGAGGYIVIPDTYGTDNIAFCGTSPDADIPTSGTATTQQLTGSGTFVAGALVRTSNAIPTVDLALSGRTEIEYCLAVDSDVTATDTFDIRLYQQDGTALDVYTVTPRLTIMATSGGMGF